MSDAAVAHSDQLRELTTRIISAYAAANRIAAEELPKLIVSVHAALTDVVGPKAAEAGPVPAVPVKRSVFPDHIVCLEDGKRMKMLKRHLLVSYGLTPEQYRLKWNLPPDYPMTAPNYSAQRSKLAKGIGLGHSRVAAVPVQGRVPYARNSQAQARA